MVWVKPPAPAPVTPSRPRPCGRCRPRGVVGGWGQRGRLTSHCFQGPAPPATHRSTSQPPRRPTGRAPGTHRAGRSGCPSWSRGGRGPRRELAGHPLRLDSPTWPSGPPLRWAIARGMRGPASAWPSRLRDSWPPSHMVGAAGPCALVRLAEGPGPPRLAGRWCQSRPSFALTSHSGPQAGGQATCQVSGSFWVVSCGSSSAAAGRGIGEQFLRLWDANCCPLLGDVATQLTTDIQTCPGKTHVPKLQQGWASPPPTRSVWQLSAQGPQTPDRALSVAASSRPLLGHSRPSPGRGRAIPRSDLSGARVAPHVFTWLHRFLGPITVSHVNSLKSLMLYF